MNIRLTCLFILNFQKILALEFAFTNAHDGFSGQKNIEETNQKFIKNDSRATSKKYIGISVGTASEQLFSHFLPDYLLQNLEATLKSCSSKKDSNKCTQDNFAGHLKAGVKFSLKNFQFIFSETKNKAQKEIQNKSDFSSKEVTLQTSFSSAFLVADNSQNFLQVFQSGNSNCLVFRKVLKKVKNNDYFYYMPVFLQNLLATSESSEIGLSTASNEINNELFSHNNFPIQADDIVVTGSFGLFGNVHLTTLTLVLNLYVKYCSFFSESNSEIKEGILDFISHFQNMIQFPRQLFGILMSDPGISRNTVGSTPLKDAFDEKTLGLNLMSEIFEKTEKEIEKKKLIKDDISLFMLAKLNFESEIRRMSESASLEKQLVSDLFSNCEFNQILTIPKTKKTKTTNNDKTKKAQNEETDNPKNSEKEIELNQCFEKVLQKNFNFASPDFNTFKSQFSTQFLSEIFVKVAKSFSTLKENYPSPDFLTKLEILKSNYQETGSLISDPWSGVSNQITAIATMVNEEQSSKMIDSKLDSSLAEQSLKKINFALEKQLMFLFGEKSKEDETNIILKEQKTQKTAFTKLDSGFNENNAVLISLEIQGQQNFKI